MPAVGATDRIQIQGIIRTDCKDDKEILLSAAARPRELLGGCHLLLDNRQFGHAPEEFLPLQDSHGLRPHPRLRPPCHPHNNARGPRRTRPHPKRQKAQAAAQGLRESYPLVRHQRESPRQHVAQVPQSHLPMARTHRQLLPAPRHEESIQETHYQTSDCDKVKRGGESTR